MPQIKSQRDLNDKIITQIRQRRRLNHILLHISRGTLQILVLLTELLKSNAIN